MKKQVLIVACVLGILCALVLPAFADDRPEYEYTIASFASDDSEYADYYPNVDINLSRPLSLVGQTWNVGEVILFDFSEYQNLVIGQFDTRWDEDPNEYNYFLRYEYITVTDLPIVFYSYSPTLATQSGAVLTGTLVVPETTPPETTSEPSAFGGSVNDGVSNSIGFAGEVLDFIVDSPILIFVGVAVGVALLAWGISKVKDLVKGY